MSDERLADEQRRWEDVLACEGLGELKADRPGGRAERQWRERRYRRVTRKEHRWCRSLAIDHVRTMLPVSWEHELLAAAVWRFPFAKHQGGWRARKQPVAKLRAIVRVLAAGGTYKQAAAKAHVSERVVARIKAAVLAWEDPDDER